MPSKFGSSENQIVAHGYVQIKTTRKSTSQTKRSENFKFKGHVTYGIVTVQGCDSLYRFLPKSKGCTAESLARVRSARARDDVGCTFRR